MEWTIHLRQQGGPGGAGPTLVLQDHPVSRAGGGGAAVGQGAGGAGSGGGAAGNPSGKQEVLQILLTGAGPTSNGLGGGGGSG